MHKFNLLPFALCIAAPFFAPALLAQGKDVVARKDGIRIRGVEITEFTHAGLKATRKGGEVIEIPGHLVLSVKWGDMPEEFISGRSAMERGDYATATQMFGEAANKASRPLVKADCEFFKLEAAVAGVANDPAAAQTAAEKARAWLEANGSHWRVPEALLLAGRAARLAGDAANATQILKELDERASREGFGPVWRARAKFELALTLESEGKPGEARSTFQAAHSAANNALATPSADDDELEEMKVKAKIGEGESYLTEKSYSRAESFFHQLTASDDPNLIAAAWAGEGEAIFLTTAESKELRELRRAQIALARASVLDAQGGDASAKANYYLGQCLLALGPDYAGDNFKNRAQAYFRIVTNNYKSSKWAAKARAALAQ